MIATTSEISDERLRLIEAVSKHCDLRERLALVPPSAKVRGLYFGSIEAVLGRAGKAQKYKGLFPERFAAVSWHPAGEFLTRLAVGGALLMSPERVHEGMYEIGRRNAAAFTESLLGRTLLRFLSRDPKKLLQQANAGRRQSTNFARWDISFPDQHTAIVEMAEEYQWIESNALGAAVGTFEAVGIPMKAEVELTSRFVGRHILRW
ncbi:MAG: TIGR02265 family protein [Myxococcales bacterium]